MVLECAWCAAKWSKLCRRFSDSVNAHPRLGGWFLPRQSLGRGILRRVMSIYHNPDAWRGYDAWKTRGPDEAPEDDDRDDMESDLTALANGTAVDEVLVERDRRGRLVCEVHLVGLDRETCEAVIRLVKERK